MDDWRNPPLPTEDERNRAVAAIVQEALPRAEGLFAQIARLFRTLSFRQLFFGMGDCLLLAGLLAILCFAAAASAVALGAMMVDAAAGRIFAAQLLFLLSPSFYAALLILTTEKNRALGTEELLRTCRVPLRCLTALRSMAFGGAATAACMLASIALWNAIDREIPLLWMMGMATSSLFVYAALALAAERIPHRGKTFAAPLAWAIAGAALMHEPEAAALLLNVPPFVFALVTLGAGAWWLHGMRRRILDPRESEACHAAG